MTLQEWLDSDITDNLHIIDDPEMMDAYQAYISAHGELVYILNKRGFDIKPESKQKNKN